MSVYIDAYICVKIDVYICVCAYMYICVHIYVYTYICIYLHICMCIFLYICIYVYICKNKLIFLRVQLKSLDQEIIWIFRRLPDFQKCSDHILAGKQFLFCSKGFGCIFPGTYTGLNPLDCSQALTSSGEES